MTALDLEALLGDRSLEVLVCCGTGGVGKTTLSAALALWAADRGRRVVLLTIDPARRLATTLGLDSLGGRPEPVPGVEDASGGSLDALMLDMTHTFDAAVLSHARPGAGDLLLKNPFYLALSRSFSGTQDYMAAELVGQLHEELRSSARWDLIVVDTPPARSALDFLDAPERLAALADGPLLNLIAPRRGPLKLLSAGLAQATRLLGTLIGVQALADLQDFAEALGGVMDGFRARAEGVKRLLSSDKAAFLVVSTPRRAALKESAFFVRRFRQDGLPLRGLVLNLTEPPMPVLDQADPPAVASWWEHRATRFRAQEESVTDYAPRGIPVIRVPMIADEVSDLESLRRLGRAAGLSQQHETPVVDV